MINASEALLSHLFLKVGVYTMGIFTFSGIRMRILLACLTVATVFGAFLFSQAFFPAAQAASASAAVAGTGPFTVTKSVITPSAVVDPTKLSLSNEPGSTL